MPFPHPHLGPEPEAAPEQTGSSQFCEWDELDNVELILDWEINGQDLSSSSSLFSFSPFSLPPLSSSPSLSPSLPSLSSSPSSPPAPSPPSSSSSDVQSSSLSLLPLSPSSSLEYSGLCHRIATSSNHSDPMVPMLASTIPTFGVSAEEVS
ncbi:hypothetical protein FRC18_002208 [Serendipita sp. 400]|nr:hypothetical protein FRC18_002208 [Serendipita sp. 400]